MINWKEDQPVVIRGNTQATVLVLGDVEVELLDESWTKVEKKIKGTMLNRFLFG